MTIKSIYLIIAFGILLVFLFLLKRNSNGIISVYIYQKLAFYVYDDIEISAALGEEILYEVV